MSLLEMGVAMAAIAAIAVMGYARHEGAAETASAREELAQAEEFAWRYRATFDCENDLPASIAMSDAVSAVDGPAPRGFSDWELRFAAGTFTVHYTGAARAGAFRRLGGAELDGDSIAFRPTGRSRGKQRGRRFFAAHVQGQASC